MITLKVKIIEEKENEIVGQVVKKELFTFPDPKAGQIYSFIGHYNADQFEKGQVVFMSSNYIPPNLRKDDRQLEMTIEKIEPDHFEPFRLDLDITVISLMILIFIGMALLSLNRKKKNRF